VEAYPMTIQRFLARWWRPLVTVLLVLAAVAGYGLARGDSGGGTGGEFSASPPASSVSDPTGPTTGPGTADGRGGVTPLTGDVRTNTSDLTDPTDPTGPGPATTATASSTTTSEQTTTRPSKPEHWAIRWILSLGPEGPTSPTSDVRPYMFLRDGDCDEALARIEHLTETDQLSDRQRAIYRGAATACLAAFHQQPQRWAEARRHLADARSSSAKLNCPERVTLAWLEQIVGLHERDPDRPFVAQQPQGFYTGIEQLVPDHGASGTQVRVEGNNLDCATNVVVTGIGNKEEKKEELPFTPDPSGRSGTFEAPAGFDAGPAQVTLCNQRENYTIGHATFTYKDKDNDKGADSSPDSSAGCSK
jgi:hypothetical protein